MCGCCFDAIFRPAAAAGGFDAPSQASFEPRLRSGLLHVHAQLPGKGLALIEAVGLRTIDHPCKPRLGRHAFSPSRMLFFSFLRQWLRERFSPSLCTRNLAPITHLSDAAQAQVCQESSPTHSLRDAGTRVCVRACKSVCVCVRVCQSLSLSLSIFFMCGVCVCVCVLTLSCVSRNQLVGLGSGILRRGVLDTCASRG